ncbi:recombination protein Bet [uncultured Mediterranean phage uvMED]|nr:recombination protein Bet [uncultured Mediterranean phage uvMED]
MTEVATADLIPFTQSQKDWNFDMKEVIRHVDPQGNGSPQEHKYFFELCKAQKLNPLIKEVYFIKYGSSPAAVVINVDTFVSRANEHPDYDGYTAGWIIGTEADPKMTEMPFGKLIGAWCKVGRKGKTHSVAATVRFEAFDTGKSRWKIDPWGMIQKCAIAAAHRKAYPKAFTGLYEWSEMDQAKDGVAKNVTPPKPAPKPLDPPPAKAKTPKKKGPVVEAVADSMVRTLGAEGLEKIEKAIDEGAVAQFTWTVDQVGQDVSQLMNPEGNPDAEAVFDSESYERIKQYKNDNFNSWKEQLETEDFDRVVGLFKQLRSEFPEEIVNSAQPS